MNDEEDEVEFLPFLAGYVEGAVPAPAVGAKLARRPLLPPEPSTALSAMRGISQLPIRAS